MDKRIAVVTGAMGDLGEAICRRLAHDGLEVVALHSPDNSQAQAWLARHEAQGYRFGAAAVDVRDFDACDAAIRQVRHQHGPVSVLVNNAGIARDASFRTMTPDDWQAVLRTNLDSMFNMTKQVIEDMLALGWGRIVNLSSVVGQRGAFGQANYAASKAGVHGFTKSLALEFARRNITVNTVSPGYLRTALVAEVAEQVLQDEILPEIPLGRLGEPAEIAEVVSYLVSERSAFVTGADISINGGQRMS